MLSWLAADAEIPEAAWEAVEMSDERDEDGVKFRGCGCCLEFGAACGAE